MGRLRSSLIGLFCLAASAAGAENLALVVGNAGYRSLPVLRNPLNDAAEVGAKLGTLGFRVVAANDLARADLVKRLADVNGGGTEAPDVVLFYFAGQGFRAAGRDYLIGVDASPASMGDMLDGSVSVEEAVKFLGIRARKAVVAIFDMCREDLQEAYGRTGTRGVRIPASQPFGEPPADLLAGKITILLDEPATAPATFPPSSAETPLTKLRVLIVQAAAPGGIAMDGEGRNSPFTIALTRHLGQEGLGLEEVFRRVRREVVEATNGQQLPWVESSLVEDVILVPAK